MRCRHHLTNFQTHCPGDILRAYGRTLGGGRRNRHRGRSFALLPRISGMDKSRAAEFFAGSLMPSHTRERERERERESTQDRQTYSVSRRNFFAVIAQLENTLQHYALALLSKHPKELQTMC